MKRKRVVRKIVEKHCFTYGNCGGGNTFHPMKNPPMCLSPDKYMPSTSRNTIVQDKEDGMNIEDHVNYMEEDDTNNIVELDDGTNSFIQDIFPPIDEENNDDIYDVPLLEKVEQPLYEGSRTNILSVIMLSVNLKVLNGLSNTCLTQILRLLGEFFLPPSINVSCTY